MSHIHIVLAKIDTLTLTDIIKLTAQIEFMLFLFIVRYSKNIFYMTIIKNKVLFIQLLISIHLPNHS